MGLSRCLGGHSICPFARKPGSRLERVRGQVHSIEQRKYWMSDHTKVCGQGTAEFSSVTKALRAYGRKDGRGFFSAVYSAS